ncbi:putative WPP domain-interacting tail-anchored protein 2-like [Capsicum annuum]|nr:putative WPP domain-interacting tail-anchored protein 2-like [Capsicum annuum]
MYTLSFPELTCGIILVTGYAVRGWDFLSRGSIENNLATSQDRGKVCICSILSSPDSWDYTGYVVGAWGFLSRGSSENNHSTSEDRELTHGITLGMLLELGLLAQGLSGAIFPHSKVGLGMRTLFPSPTCGLIMDSTMKHSKDPFEASIEEEEGSHPESPVGLDENETEDQAALSGSAHGGDDANINPGPENCLTSRAVPISVGTAGSSNKIKEEDEEEEEENMDVQFGKFPSSSDPDKVVKMQYHISGKVVRFAWAGVCKRGENWEGATIVACIQGRIVMAAPTNSKRSLQLCSFLVRFCILTVRDV